MPHPRPQQASFRSLNVAIAGTRIGGQRVILYERYDFAGEVGASSSLASNGSKWLLKWGLDMDAVQPAILKQLIMHEWENGKVINQYPLGNYKERFGPAYYSSRRIDMQKPILKAVTQSEGVGIPCKILTNHLTTSVDPTSGTITFENGNTATAELIVATRGIRSRMRTLIGVTPQFKSSSSCCSRCIISATKLRELIMSACHDREVISCYCFYSAERNGLDRNGWNIEAIPGEIINTFLALDEKLKLLFRHAEDIKMWYLYIHDEYSYWVKGRGGLLGDASHPPLPDQKSEGERATTVQNASARAGTGLSERIGWSTGLEMLGKLTIGEVCGYDVEETFSKLVESE
ncbi:salicylate hydroxylase [Amniculicola lignicola CBS 123094]|uniref:Salicylate hydroxylase n=1 Tax=Amniculicola lignicola CBS 123094 TaxID=1392246 RepID=A0A6A5X3D5_9PLEO|nr:salicylate hydroxylase [Amniculicola lignicola CBS 123094]